MNKSDLIQLKKSLDKKNLYTQYIGKEGPLFDSLSQFDIMEMLDSREETVNFPIDIFKKMMVYLAEQDINYSSLSLSLYFSVFVDSNLINEEYFVENKRAILNDYVGITFGDGYVHRNKQSRLLPNDALGDDERIIYTSFSDFVVGLNECGFELEGIESFSDIKDAILEDKRPCGRIRVSFPKNKTYSKSN